MRLTQKQCQLWGVMCWWILYAWVSSGTACKDVCRVPQWLILGVSEVAAQPNEAMFRNVDADTTSELALVLPAVTLLHPTEGLLTALASQILLGTVSDLQLTTATLHHNSAVQTIAVSNGTLGAVITLAEGRNTLSVSASNEAGTGTSAEIDVTLDTLPPQLMIMTPLAQTVLLRGADIRRRDN